MSFAEQIDRSDRSAPRTALAQKSPGMKMLLAEDPRFEWSRLRAHEASDMVLTLRDGASFGIDDARTLIAACDQLELKGWLHGDYSRPGSYKIQGVIDPAQCHKDDVVPRNGTLITPLDFGADRIHAPVDVAQFSVKVSANTYREVIEPQQKKLAIGG